MTLPAGGWYRDPTGRFTHRYWTGEEWTEHVSREGVTSQDPIPEAQRTLPPAPETLEPAPAPPPPTVTVTQRTGAGAILGWVVALLAIGVLVIALVALTGDDEAGTSTTAPAEVATTAPAEVTTTAPAEVSTVPSG